ncbi:MobF family relaxase [Mycobacterium marinum]|uniref:MobF family relaxase n=1 Tax=Mycobacterium marinum TaxID=1781 RepID=UPI003561AE24
MLTISRLSRWSIAYYENTANEAKQSAMDRHAAGGGLGEYYSEADTRVPTWIVSGDAARVAELTGLTGAAVAGGFADGQLATAWLDNGIAPNGAGGRALTKESVHGFDLTFAAPKSVSLVRALTSDINEKVVAEAHMRAVKAALDYLHQHAGYTRVHNPLTGNKDLIGLPGLVGIAYQHETSRCGDPHLHTHVIIPNRQPRADGKLVSIDSKSLYHETKAAGIVYQAVLRHELHAERNFEWAAIGEHSGMAEIAGITRRCLKAWSQRSTRLREWARNNLAIVDGQPTAEQLSAAQKATRPKKPESLAWAELKEQWRADARELEIDRAAHHHARRVRARAPRLLIDRARLTRMVDGIDKAAFTRADMVELVGALLPVDAPGNPREVIEKIVDTVAVRVTATRECHHREGHEKFTVDAVIAEEERIFAMVDEHDTRTRLDVRAEDIGDLSDDQARAIGNIAASPYLLQPLQAPAGAGKTHSLKALRAGAHRAGKEVLVLAPTGKAVDEAMRDEAGDRGMTVAAALNLIEDDQLRVDRRTVIVVDEASMIGTPELSKLLKATTSAKTKIVLVGDAHQLSPVKARGGMFEQLCVDLPWAQRLSEVWRMRSAEERDASLALRSGRGNRLRKAVGWYRNTGRLHTGDQVAMATDATNGYIAASDAGKDAAIICDRWEIADAINHRLSAHYTSADAPAVEVARDQHVRVGDVIISRNNDATITVEPGPDQRRGQQVDQVRNGNRWRVAGVDTTNGRIAAERLTDNARTVFESDYLREHITLGYASTVHSAQGMTVGGKTLGGQDRAGVCWTVLSDRASRAMAYVGMTRARDENHVAIYPAVTNEAHQHQHGPVPVAQEMRRGTKHQAAAALHTICTANDERAQTLHAVAEKTDRTALPPVLAKLLGRNDERKKTRAQDWQNHTAQTQARQAALERIIEETTRAHRSRGRDQGYGLEL